ncbi:right-handed parallel beta-helix repeat-containing protein [bacterium]|nr:right-handed parallel beta-helix repeat-containing protein [bacterium]MCB2179238.1 right-handed parallel beta-helix repeat-containing protein [bacterium]
MNAQQNTMIRFLKVLTTALMLATLLYGVMPAQPAYASDFVVNDAGDAEDAELNGTCDISPGDGTPNCTLRAAIMEANYGGGVDVITFSTNMTISLSTVLDTIQEAVVIDASSTPGWVTLDGNGGTFNGLNIQAGSVTIRNLAFVDFDGSAINVSGGTGGVVIDHNYIGTPTSGTTDGGVTGYGVRVSDSPNVEITDNLISGNDLGGIYITGAASDGAVITGNNIGMNLAGDARLEDTETSGADGISLSSVTNATIGGSTAALRNEISGNYGDGIQVVGTSTGTTIDGNYIGVSAVGEESVPNLTSGIRISSASGVSMGVNQWNLISGNDGPGVVISSSSDITVTGNTIGLDVDGDTLLGNVSYGISMTSSSDVTITGNTISGNTGSGIRMAAGTTGAVLTDNRIGIGVTSAVNLGNTNHGIFIDNSHDNMIGGTSTSLGNIIAYNGGAGIMINNTDTVTYNSYGNTIVSNSIYNNGGLGIDLAPSGVNLNDTNDADNGPNYLQNFLTFTAKQTDTGVQITGSLNTDINRPNYRIEFYEVNNCDASGYGEGRTLVDVLDLTIISSTTAVDYEIPDTSIPAGSFLTNTVTYDEGTGGLKDTSEFSPCAVVQEPDSPGSSGVFVVNSTSDTPDANIGDGFCADAGGDCTLRAAIQEANAGSEPPYTITFNISGTAPFTISPTSAFDAITVPLIIKGKPSGDTGAPVIVLNGSGAGSANGLTISANNSKVDGLSIVNFSGGSAIEINATGVSITNNYLGLGADGSTVGANLYGVLVNGVINNTISSNVISGNTHGVRLRLETAQNNQVLSNFIGTDVSGTLDKGNTSDGIRLEGAQNNIIQGNLVSGNNSDGIEITGGAGYNAITDNFIGVKLGGTSALANSGHGINVNSASSNNQISDGNVIDYNGLAGVYVSGGIGNLISENSIFSNLSTGIQLASGGNLITPAPVLNYANQGGSYVFVSGELSGMLADTEYTLEFFTNSAGDQGEVYVFTSTATTDGSGYASFTAAPPVSVADGTIITATATDSDNNTSEFSNDVRVYFDAPVLTSTPTVTPTVTNTPTATLNTRPTPTPRPTQPSATPTNTSAVVATNTSVSPSNTPTATTGGGGGSGTTLTITITATITNTPTITSTPTLVGPYQTLTALAANNTVEPTSTPVTPTSTKVATATEIPPTETPTATLAQSSGDLPDDGTGGGGDVDGSGGGEDGGVVAQLFGGGSFTTILWIFIGLAVILLMVGGAMELMRWMNSRE